jgi:hypothetical protein
VLAYYDTLLITWVESENVYKVWDLKHSLLVKNIKSPIKEVNVLQLVVSGDFMYSSYHQNSDIVKFSISQGKALLPYQTGFPPQYYLSLALNGSTMFYGSAYSSEIALIDVEERVILKSFYGLLSCCFSL